MSRKYLISFFALFLLVACGETWIEKPEGLISEKKMVEMLLDMHIANSIYKNKSYIKNDLIRSNPESYYYSVLKKHEIADSVFEKSIVYYSYFPKDFEKIYERVLDKASQMQEKYQDKKPEPVNLGRE